MHIKIDYAIVLHLTLNNMESLILKTNKLIQSLNKKITSESMSCLDKSQIEDIIHREIESVFGIDNKIKAHDYQSLVPKKLKKNL